MSTNEVAKWFAAAVGAVLVLVGLLGFVQNPIVGDPPAMFHTGLVHNIVHIATGAVALYIAFGLAGAQRAMGLIVFGVVYALVLVLTLVSQDMFGLLEHPVNTADHLLHAGLAVASIGVGWWARNEATV